MRQKVIKMQEIELLYGVYVDSKPFVRSISATCEQMWSHQEENEANTEVSHTFVPRDSTCV